MNLKLKLILWPCIYNQVRLQVASLILVTRSFKILSLKVYKIDNNEIVSGDTWVIYDIIRVLIFSKNFILISSYANQYT